MSPPDQKLALQGAVGRGTKSSLIGIAVNLGLALTKCTAGLLGHSFALVADGLESAADVVSGLVVLFGLKLSIKPPDADHPYGHGKAEPIAALIVGVSLLGAAGTIIYESLHQILTPHPLPKPYTLVVLAGVLIIKEQMFRYVGHVGESIASTAVRSDAWHHRSDAITSAFAFCGISVALIGGSGWEAADDWAALCAGLVIIYNALKQAKPALWELTDSAPEDPSLEAKVRAVAASQPEIIGIDKLHARKMGLSYYVDLHIVVHGQLSVRDGHRIAHAVEREILSALPQVSEVLVHVEPEEELASHRAGNRF
jgi:cation diffusion facilitator family transporter